MMSNSLNRFIAVSAFSFLLLLLVNSGEVFSEETEVAKNGTTTSAENSNSTSTAGKDSPALISLHPPHSPLLRESQLSSLSSSPPPLPPPRYNRRPPPQPRQPSYYSHPHNPHQYHHHHPHDHSHDHHHHHPYPNPHHYDDPYHHHYHHPHHLHSSPSPSFYPRSPPPTPSLLPALDPAQLGDLVSGFGQAFSNFLSQRVRAAPADRQARLLNGEHNILATASQLLPAAANRLLGGLQQLQQQPGFGIQSRSTLSPLRGLAQSPKSSSGNETTSSSSSSSPDDGQPSAAASSDHQTMVSSSEPLSPPPSPSPSSSPPGAPPINYDEEGRRLREDIIARVGHLQNVLTTAMEVSKERRDILTRRLLEQTNLRLEQAKARMDRILSEPQNAQMVLRALQTVNQGVSGITAFLQGLLQRINVSVNVKMNEPPPPSNFSTELPPDSSNGTITAAASKPE